MAIKNSGGNYLPGTDIDHTVAEWTFDAADYGAIVNGTDFANWGFDASGSFGDAEGAHIIQDGTNDRAWIEISGLDPSSDYWLRVSVSSSPGAGNLRLMGHGFDSSNIGEASAPTVDFNLPAGTGDNYVKVTTDATANPGPYRLTFRHASGGAGEFIVFKCSLWKDAPDSSAPVMVLGDRSGGWTQARGDSADAIITDPSLITNDVISIGDVSETAQSYSTQNDALNAAIAGDIWPTAGNHDYDHTPLSAAGNYLDYFPHIVPLSPASGDLRTYYSKVIGRCEFFFFDDNTENTDNAGMGTKANVQASTMGQWLLSAIAASSAIWKIVVIHHPPRSSSSAGGDYTNMAWDWGSLGVCLVLAGHKHSLEVQDWTGTNEGCIYGVIGMGGGNHHGWGTIDPETLWREENTAIEASMKIWDGVTRLTLEIWDENIDLQFRYGIQKN